MDLYIWLLIPSGLFLLLLLFLVLYAPKLQKRELPSTSTFRRNFKTRTLKRVEKLYNLKSN